jgi:hypothetical protein
MELIADLMQNEVAIIALGITVMVFGFLGFVALAVIGVVATFVRPAPGGPLTLTGVLIILFMYLFAWLMTSTMELQYGPTGGVFEAAVYVFGGFFCVMGYVRITWAHFRSRHAER